MNTEDLLANGFGRYLSPAFSTCDFLYQLRVQDKVGVRYHVNVYHWEERDGRPAGQEVEVYFRSGVKGFPPHAVKIMAYGLEGWAARDAVQWAEVVWDALRPGYYETFHGGEE